MKRTAFRQYLFEGDCNPSRLSDRLGAGGWPEVLSLCWQRDLNTGWGHNSLPDQQIRRPFGKLICKKENMPDHYFFSLLRLQKLLEDSWLRVWKLPFLKILGFESAVWRLCNVRSPISCSDGVLTFHSILTSLPATTAFVQWNSFTTPMTERRTCMKVFCLVAPCCFFKEPHVIGNYARHLLDASTRRSSSYDLTRVQHGSSPSIYPCHYYVIRSCTWPLPRTVGNVEQAQRSRKSSWWNRCLCRALEEDLGLLEVKGGIRLNNCSSVAIIKRPQ